MSDTFLFFFAATSWGLSYEAIGILVKVLPPFVGTALRLTVSFLFFACWMLLRRKQFSLKMSSLPKILLLSLLLQAIPFALLFWGEQRVDPALAGIIVSSGPLFTVLFALFLKIDQRELARKMTGILVGFGGILVVFAPKLQLQNLAITSGILAILACAICYSWGNLLMSRWGSGLERWTNLTIQAFVSMTLIWGLAFSTEPVSSIANVFSNPEAFASVLYLGIISSGLAWVALFILIDRIGSIRTSTVCYPMAIISIVAQSLHTHSLPPSSMIWGTLLILFGVFLVQWRGLGQRLPVKNGSMSIS